MTINTKKRLASKTNKGDLSGNLLHALKGADVFIGVSAPNLLKPKDIGLMAEKPVIFALANPNPEILPADAYKGGAFVYASGRSDFENQVNNSLAFPGIFKGALEVRANRITEEMKLAAAEGLAGLVKKPTRKKIIPGPFDNGVCDAVSSAVRKEQKN